MPELRFSTEIEGSPEAIFAAITDLTGYHRWLDASDSFGGIRDIAPAPVGLGTTYVDHGPSGTRHGTIVEFTPPSIVTFHQPMRLKGPIAGTIDIRVRCTLEPGQGTTRVTRDLSVKPHGFLVLAQPLILATMRRENERVLAALKRHVEASRLS
jgi:uncharacterized protein YndB with AHSA1/START domain